jgi:hypothetical protein
VSPYYYRSFQDGPELLLHTHVREKAIDNIYFALLTFCPAIDRIEYLLLIA